MQNNDIEKTHTATDRDDEASNSDGATEETVGDRDDEATSHDGVEETSADRESDDPNRGEGIVAEPTVDDEDPNCDTEQAVDVTSADRDDRDRKDTRKSVSKKGDCVWTMYLPSTSGKETLAVSNNNYGCEHYKRKSKFVTPCCNKVYTCRFCHDEQEAHTVNRKEVTELICVLCDTRQPVQATCQNCHCQFGKYTCLECNLFDDEDKNQYHCDGCGICRVGGRDKFFHCAKCNMCLPIQLQNGHTCIENVSHSNCPVCLEDIHTSRIPCHIPDCGHLLHRMCFEELLNSGHYACPSCQVSLLDMTDLWKYLDAEVSLTPMPEEYNDCKTDILCKDCHEESTVKFHIVGLKCLNCGSYNTCRIKGSPCSDPDALNEAAGITEEKEGS
ncbi:PREDICTED: RING finger and CHY zinc finger domain-containing protein 1 [Acromyrmex echinatior]|uniref:RING finger and CHY zinc finger domain-containing protein 1 n=1 Tax=Acromyrmex echinatior TaxID=103372 RepID=F4X179_ACREC|nr:PREDICTED: RING finger and CHY zinc finger domain-containing protein 1 [Acromyrmex echinatior]EGI59751.1 RING finger and CHY zinc finger domain-containing protein 1 [Acromyrmex echinatior]